MVRICIDGTVCDNLKEYFEMINHGICTRNRKYLLRLPRLKLEYGKSSFFFMGARTYNELPIELRKKENYNEFVSALKAHLP